MTRQIGIQGALFLACALGAGIAGADAPPPHQPPPEAIEACAKLAVGDACSVTFHGHSMDGTCRAAPDGSGPVACAPSGPPPHCAPPPEAFEACAKLTAGAACSVTFDGHTMDGTCKTGPDGKGALACAPDGPPPPR